ncbi:MAG: hypothetical protein FJ333_10260, partial [Sphingomonadales bacterium]|nr:hypothetical protein [Sphingomonadales bacterium]
MLFKNAIESVDSTNLQSISVAGLDTLVADAQLSDQTALLYNDFEVLATLLERKRVKICFCPPICWPSFNDDTKANFRSAYANLKKNYPKFNFLPDDIVYSFEDEVHIEEASADKLFDAICKFMKITKLPGASKLTQGGFGSSFKVPEPKPGTSHTVRNTRATARRQQEETQDDVRMVTEAFSSPVGTPASAGRTGKKRNPH